MKRKIKICVLMIMLFMALAVGSYSTYAFLTDTNIVECQYQIGTINGTVEVTGDAVVDTVITNDDLAYIHYQDDMIENKFGLLDEMASEIKVSIKFNNTFATRVKVQVPSVNNTLQYGLMYIVIEDSAATKNLDVKLQVVDGILQYAFENENTDGTLTWRDSIKELTTTLSNDDLRTKVDEYNKSILITLYENNSFAANTDNEFNFRILIWGDYYSLTEEDKAKYLEMGYEFVVTAKVIQDIKEYGGTLNYEND